MNTNNYILLAKQRISQAKIPLENCKFRYSGCGFVQVNIGNQLPYLMYCVKF